jgi:SNF2 family DNA or RNA helicase
MSWPFNMPPLPVQAEALKRADESVGFAFFMDPGMGKTGTVMAEFTNMEKKGTVDLLFVICPNNLRANWKTEAEKMGFEYDVSIYPEPPPKVGMWVVNYEKIISTAFDTIYGVLKKRKFYGVCDESHRIKNFKAKTSKAIIFLFDLATVKRVMTGTPLANNVVDLWSQLRAINKHGAHRSPYTFRNRYGLMGGWMGKQVVGTQREEELRDIMSLCTFRAKKKEWMASLPPKVYSTLGYELNAKQKQAYNQIYRDRFLAVDDGQEVTAQMVITALMKMQQVTSGFMIDDKGEIIDFCSNKNPKIDAVVDAMEDIVGKAIVFAHYQQTVNLLEKGLKDYKPLVIRGGMKADDVRELVKAFNGEDDRRVLIAQTATAKEGLTLLGTENQPCFTTIFVENTYSLIDRTQAEDRNHRHGQTAEQVCYFDMVGSPLESKIIKALQSKNDLVKTVMESRNV